VGGESPPAQKNILDGPSVCTKGMPRASCPPPPPGRDFDDELGAYVVNMQPEMTYYITKIYARDRRPYRD
jgi:hypothetical protein